MTTTKTKITSIVIAMLMLMTCFGIMAQSAQAKKGEYGGFFVWSECNGTDSDGVWKLKSKNKFTIKYQAKKKGTYKVDLYKSNKKGKKVAYIGTYKIKATKKLNENYVGYITFKKASSKTYYRIFAKSKGTIPSAVAKTKQQNK